MKRLLIYLGLPALLAACTTTSPNPNVASVTPENGATGVARDVTVQAQLNLKGGDVNLTTLSDASVKLTGPSGPVAAKVGLDGTALTLDPVSTLDPETSYTFSVSGDLQLASGTAFSPFSSDFTTGTEEPLGLVIRNAMGLPSENRMVLSKVGNYSGNPCEEGDLECDPNRWQAMAFYDSGTLALENTGTEPLTVTLTTNPATLFSLSASTVTVAPGDTEDVTVTFLGTGLTEKGFYPATLTATSGDQIATLTVVGVFQQRPEGSSEIAIGQLIEAFGYQTDIGANSSGFLSQDEADSPKAGSEVRSHYWRAADTGEPVVTSQLAAFLPCCGTSQATFDFELFTQSGAKIARLPHDTNYNQSIFPPAPNGREPNTLSLTTGATFRFDIYGYSSIPKNGFLGVRFWPLVDETGNAVANTYIVAQDFARGPCGSGGTDENGTSLGSNCDYNDGIYLVENIEPVEPY